MGTCASVSAAQVQPLPLPAPERPAEEVTAVFTRSHVQTTTRKEEITLELKDATPQKLRDVFKLDFNPKELTNKAANVTKVHQGAPDEPFSGLEANAEYEVGREKDEDFYNMETTQRPTMKSSDVQRALLCCEAVYLPDTNAVQQLFADQRNLHDFVRVNVTRRDGTVKYLLAETRDKEEVFVAFRGTKDFNDVLANLRIWQKAPSKSIDSHDSGVGGKFHAGFMDLAFRVPVHCVLEKYKNSRIVVCGHSLGGAVAHMVALNMMVHLRSWGQPVDNVKSIAFGAPYFGNNGAQQFAEEHNLSPRLLTIVHEGDPVPYILRLAQTLQCAGMTAVKEAEDLLTKARPIILGILGFLTVSGVVGLGSLAVAGAFTAIQMPAKLDECKRLLGIWGLFAQDLDALYVPLGWYVAISCSTTKAGGGGAWRRSLLTHPGAIQYIAPDIKAWRVEDFQCHRVSHYRATFFEIARKTMYHDDDETPPSGDVILTDAIFPTTIEKLSVFMIEGGGQFRSKETCQIFIDGDNLDFLEKDVPLAGVGLPVQEEDFEVLSKSRRKVVLECKVDSDRLLEADTIALRTHCQEVAISKETIEIKRVPEFPHKKPKKVMAAVPVVQVPAVEEKPPVEEETPPAQALVQGVVQAGGAVYRMTSSVVSGVYTAVSGWF